MSQRASSSLKSGNDLQTSHKIEQMITCSLEYLHSAIVVVVVVDEGAMARATALMMLWDAELLSRRDARHLLLNSPSTLFIPLPLWRALKLSFYLFLLGPL